MSQILELDAQGNIVPVDMREDKHASIAGPTIEQSTLPAFSKDQSIIAGDVGACCAECGDGDLGAMHRRGDKAVYALQLILNKLAPVIKDSRVKTTADGLMGPKTQAATNLALTKIKAQVKLPMSQAGIKSKAEQLTRLVAAYIGKQTRKPTKSADVERLQNALNELARAAKDPSVATKPDGYTGPNTAMAATAALMRHVKPSKLNFTLPLSAASAQQHARLIARLISEHINSYYDVAAHQDAEPADAPAPKPAPKPKPAWKPSKTANVARLQRALTRLGTFLKVPALKLKDDGFAGPLTHTAVNLAFAKYVPAKNVNLPISPQGTQYNAAGFASAISAFVSAQEKAKAAEAAQAQAKVQAAKKAEPQKVEVIDRNSIATLQRMLKALGEIIPNVSLKKLVDDGIVGPKTQAATNLALSRYVAGVPKELASGKLTRKQIESGAGGLAQYVFAETQRRRAAAKVKPAPKPTTEEKAATVQKQAEAVKAAAPPHKRPTIDRTLVKALQRTLNELADVVKNKNLRVTEDGVVGSQTRGATNTALRSYARKANARLRAGNLTTRLVGLAAPTITKVLQEEIATRRIEENTRAAQAREAEERLGKAKADKVKEVAAKAAAGDREAQEQMANVAKAAVSEDPEAQQQARDAMDVAINEVGKKSEAVDDGADPRDIWAYTDERTINMPVELLEDAAEVNDADLGAQLALGEYAQGDMGWGFARRLARRAKRMARRHTRKVARRLRRYAPRRLRRYARRMRRLARRGYRLAKRGARQLKNISTLPIRLQLRLIRRYALPLAKMICRLPQHLLTHGAMLADVKPRYVHLFCSAVRDHDNVTVKKLLPIALKLAVKLAIQGQFPAAVPIIRAIKMIPGVTKLPGMSWIAGDLGAQIDAIPTGMLLGGAMHATPGAVCGSDLLVGDPMAMYDDLEYDDTTMDGELEDPPGLEYLREDSNASLLGACGGFADYKDEALIS